MLAIIAYMSLKKRLGNMTLLKNTINSKIKNDKFELKKNVKNSIGENIGYLGSKLAINEQLSVIIMNGLPT